MMKKRFFAVLLLFCCLASYAQEKKGWEKSTDIKNPLAAGLGLEWNMDSRSYFAGGAAFSFDFKLPCFFAVGFTATGSTNFSDFKSLELTGLLRNYVQWNAYSGLFLQIDVGSFIIFENGDVSPMVEIGARAGFRIPLGSVFYVEPYGRIGVPFAFGLGVMAGINF